MVLVVGSLNGMTNHRGRYHRGKQNRLMPEVAQGQSVSRYGLCCVDITIICGFDYIFSVTKKATGPKVSDRA